jgi:type IV pilus assembly protein PilV
MISRHDPWSAGEDGFSLIEVLVTTVVVSIGLLGLAGLHLNGLRYTHSAYYRSQAILLGNDIVDRMRANRTAASSGAYDITVGTQPSAASCRGAAANCSPTDMANADLYEWKQALAATLPSGDGAIERQGSGFRLIIQWDDSRGQEPVEAFTFDTVL